MGQEVDSQVGLCVWVWSARANGSATTKADENTNHKRTKQYCCVPLRLFSSRDNSGTKFHRYFLRWTRGKKRVVNQDSPERRRTIAHGHIHTPSTALTFRKDVLNRCLEFWSHLDPP